MCDEEGQVQFWEWSVSPFTRKPIIHPADVEEIRQRINDADEVVLQNSKFDMAALATIGIEWEDSWWPKVHDTLYSGHLLASGEPHDLTYLALRYLGVDIKPFEDNLERMVKECQKIVKREFPKWKLAKEGDPMLPSAKSSKGKAEGKLWKYDMWLPRAIARTKKLPPEHEYWTGCQLYSNMDSSVTLPVWKVHERLLKERGLWQIYLERIKLIRVIYNMEKNGITFSHERLNSMITQLSGESADCAKTCISLSGGLLDKLPESGTSNGMKKLLFEEWKLPVLVKTDKGAPSCDKTALENWSLTLEANSKQLTFVNNLRRYRRKKTTCQYGESYNKFGLTIGPNGWEAFRLLHPSLNSTGSNTLRFTCSCPNEQNISKQADEEGNSLRTVFGPGPGREWWSADFKNLELVLPAYESGEQVMIDLFEKPDEAPFFGSYHLLVASIIYPKEFWECVEKGEDFKKKYKSTKYQWVKNFNFACQYGAMEESGTADRAAHLPGAQRLVKKSLFKIAELNKYQIDFANEHGYVLTIPDKEVGGNGYPVQCTKNQWGKVLATVPLSYHIQSTAMWATCKAMRRCHDYLTQWNKKRGLKGRDGAFITAQIHDEMIFDLPITTSQESIGVARELKRLMEMSGIHDLGIPISVDVSYHPENWGTETKVELDNAA